jgi:hypothetical protein
MHSARHGPTLDMAKLLAVGEGVRASSSAWNPILMASTNSDISYREILEYLDAKVSNMRNSAICVRTV